MSTASLGGGSRSPLERLELGWSADAVASFGRELQDHSELDPTAQEVALDAVAERAVGLRDA